MSIMPLLIAAPMKTPMEAIISTRLKDAAREPIAEFRKFTASLLTPTERSNTASMNRKIITQRKSVSINISLVLCFYNAKVPPECFKNVTFRINGG